MTNMHSTTKQHFEKYAQMAAQMHVSLDADSLPLFGVRDLDRLRELYAQDPNLNNIPLRRFDAFYPWLRQNVAPKVGLVGFSMAECTCLYKHLLKFQVLGLTPEFTD